MTVEQIELRRILTQMLADNGINRATIKDVVREIISEKVDKAISEVFHQTDVDGKIDRMIGQYARTAIYDITKTVIREKVNDCFSSVSVTVKVNNAMVDHSDKQ